MNKGLRFRAVPFFALVLLLAGTLPADLWPGPQARTAAASRVPDSGQEVDTVWQIETVDSAGDVGWDTSIAVDAQGLPHISYCAYGPFPPGEDTCRTLKYAWFDGAVWNTGVVDANWYVGTDNSLALDAQGHPHIAYAQYTCFGGCAGTALKYASFDGTSWQIETVDSGTLGDYTSLALDSQDRPHISYFAADNVGLKHAWHDGSTWHTEVVDGPGYLGTYTSIALDNLDHPRIVYKHNTDSTLNYAWHDGSQWHTEVIESNYNQGHWNSLALDAQDRPHVSYYNRQSQDITYTWRDEAGWHREVLEQYLGWTVQNSLAIDSLGRPRLVYYAGDYDYDLRYAWRDGTSWQIETVDGAGDVGLHASLALSALDEPHVAYFDATNGDLKYAFAPCIPMDRLDVAGPAQVPTGVTGYYTASYTPTYATVPVIRWDSGTIGPQAAYTWTTPGTYTIAVSATNPCSQVTAGVTVTAFCQPVEGLAVHGPAQRYAGQEATYQGAVQPVTASRPLTLTWDNGSVGSSAVYSWSLPGVYTQSLTATNACGFRRGTFSVVVMCLPVAGSDFSWQPLSPAVGQPVILTASVASAGLNWISETVDALGNVGRYTSLALDAQGRPHIAYQDYTNRDLKYAFHDGTSWHVEVVDGGDNTGWSPSLALDAQGWPHISYNDYALKYASFDGSAWSTETVGPGLVASLRLDAADHPHLSFRDSGRLMYAWHDGTAWQTQLVDPGGDAGRFNSLALDSAGYPHISYYDGNYNRLMYAYYDGATWRTEVVDESGWMGWYNSLALDTADHPHIAYFEAIDGILHYAHWDGTTWHSEVVDDIGDVGSWSSLALDSAGHPHVSYYDSTAGNLRYAWHDGSRWFTQTVDQGNDVGEWTSLALDSSDQPHVSYYDVSRQDLRYAAGTGLFPSAPLTYTWALGDGSWAGGKLITHTYDVPGVYTVVLTATNCQGVGVAAVSHTLTVSGSIPCDPVHDTTFTWAPFTPTVGLPVTLTAAASGTTPISFTWDLGDGTTGAGITFTHTYTSPGNYTVTLTATNCATATAVVTHSLVVIPPCEPPHDVDFAWFPITPTVGEVVAFTATAVGTKPLTFTWDFGDGGMGGGAVISRTFTAAGTHTVLVTASNGCGQAAAGHDVKVMTSLWRIYLPRVDQGRQDRIHAARRA